MGPGQIQQMVLKECTMEFAIPLIKLFRESIKQGKIPVWKRVWNIFRVFKWTTRYFVSKIQYNSGTFKIYSRFELAVQQAMRQAFHNNCSINGCCFHYFQALLKHIGSLGLKADYNRSFSLKYWVKRYMGLDLIPIEELQDGLNVIIGEFERLLRILITLCV